MTDPARPVAPLHAQCHDVVCNGSRDHPRGASGVCCSCQGRSTAYAELEQCRADLAVERAQRQHLETDLAALRAGWIQDAVEIEQDPRDDPEQRGAYAAYINCAAELGAVLKL